MAAERTLEGWMRGAGWEPSARDGLDRTNNPWQISGDRYSAELYVCSMDAALVLSVAIATAQVQDSVQDPAQVNPERRASLYREAMAAATWRPWHIRTMECIARAPQRTRKKLADTLLRSYLRSYGLRHRLLLKAFCIVHTTA